MMNRPVFSTTAENPLFDQTDWESHQHLTVGVHANCGFNDVRVLGMVEIIQHEDGDYGDESDFRDIEQESSIVTTAEGARKLAAMLIAAADCADEHIAAQVPA